MKSIDIIKKEVEIFLKENKNITEERKIFNALHIDKIETVDIHSGDFKTGTLANQEVFLLKSGNRYVLLFPIKGDASIKPKTIVSLDGGNDPKLNKGTWEIITKLNDISQLFKYTNIPEIKLILTNTEDNLPNDVVLDLYGLVDTEMRKYVRAHKMEEFNKDFNEAFGNEYKIVKQEPSKERDNKIKVFIEKYIRKATRDIKDYYDNYLK